MKMEERTKSKHEPNGSEGPKFGVGAAVGKHQARKGTWNSNADSQWPVGLQRANARVREWMGT